jgi:hypothetical protein
MAELIVHIIEPTARSTYGHHFSYCERIKEYLWQRGINSVCYFAREAAGDAQLRVRARHDKFVFKFRFGQAFADNLAGLITDDDSPKRRSIKQRKQIIAERGSDGSIEADNLIWRMQYDLDALAGPNELSKAEETVVAEALADWQGFVGHLAANFADNNNVLFLPTGEFFLLRALRDILPQLSGLVRQVHVRLWNFQSLERKGADLVHEAVALEAECRLCALTLCLYSEVEWGCKHLTQAIGSQAGYLDINSFSDISNRPTESGESLDQAPNRDTKPSRHRIFFPGSYRRFPDKGLAFLRAIFLTDPFPAKVEIVLQELDFAAAQVEAERVRANTHILILPRILEDFEYRNEFAIATAICLPYDSVTWPDQYRGSGVMMEAFRAAKPLIVRRGSPLTRYSASFFVNEVADVTEFWSMLKHFDETEQTKRADANRTVYSRWVGSNDFIANLPADAERKPLLRFVSCGGA